MRDWENFVLKCACVLGLLIAAFIYVLMGVGTRISPKNSKNCQPVSLSKCEIKKELSCKECKHD